MRVLAVVGCGIVISIFAIIAIAGGLTYHLPDYVHTNYGFPLKWGTHTLSTIAGPADIWNIDLWALAIDLACWFGALVSALSVLTALLQKKQFR